MSERSLTPGIAAMALLAALPGTTGAEGAAASAPSCAAAAYRDFDYWVGSWDVTANGKAAGSNRIESVLGGCALYESWTGAGGSHGHSLSFYDAATGQWHQTWIDDEGGALKLDGGLRDGAMTLTGTARDAASGQLAEQRITWSRLPDGAVRQHWEQRLAPDAPWQTVFDGLYRRRPDAAAGGR